MQMQQKLMKWEKFETLLGVNNVFSVVMCTISISINLVENDNAVNRGIR